MGRKTDIADAQWIAQLALNELIKPSRIFPKKQREIRNLTRSREHLVNNRIDELDEEIGTRMNDRKKDLKIATSIPGIGKVSAMTILAEIGSYEEFVTPEKLAAWSGLIPSIYQSAEHLKTGPITKRGSPHIRRIMVEVAQAAVKTKNSRLRSFFLKLKMKKGCNKAIVAVARKNLCILWTILKKRELYSEENIPSKKGSISLKSSSHPRSILEAIEILGRAGYMIRKLDSSGG